MWTFVCPNEIPNVKHVSHFKIGTISVAEKKDY